MEKYTETQRRILEVGKKEFLAKGFRDASLRGIVKDAGFTQGAFYGYYSDKAALFDALVSEAADSLTDQFKAAQEAHYDLIPEDKAAESRDLSKDYLNHFINYIYDNFDAFKLVICCSEGTRYAGYIHDLVEIEVVQTENYHARLRQLGKLKGTVSHELHHMITSAYFTAVFETVAHDMTREQAIDYVNELATFFNCGWDGLLRLE
ncbi:TetR/AcrR family transcriptional regulator [Lacrimispora sp. NSJ-141]|uniref:TetR/AcrR family transcriptional regulator n=1 Tax=Lientehia hominis TaxID=2897778 RepID=A0AAP2W9C1_9FIRM|nr:TetR/AcrR family transcriptional regulator [Lientehia hominis]MCD2491574.1 TetR/AcrR family transcriptional regulator [Lientehia hominis]